MMPLAFAFPWALAGLALLPVLWWLLKVTPPPPKVQRFPAIRLLFGLEPRDDAADRTPPWILVLRLALAAALLLAAAQPLVNPGGAVGEGGGPLVLVIDDGWAAARDWPERLAWADDLLARAERASRPVAVLTTAPAGDGKPVSGSLMAPAKARALVQALAPKPWPTDRAAMLPVIKAMPRDTVKAVVWLSDGLDDSQGQEFASALQSLGGGVEVVEGRTGRVLLPPVDDPDPDKLVVPVRRVGAVDSPDTLVVRAIDTAGRGLGRQEVGFAPGKVEATAVLRLPAELRNRLTRLDIENERGAASVVLLDERWRRRPVGLAAGGSEAQAPLLDQLYYLERALTPLARVQKGELVDLLEREQAVLMLADVSVIVGSTASRLQRWIEAGGVLVRFAGPALAQSALQAPSGDGGGFLPVRLRAGGRSLGGAMSWTTPQGLDAFPEQGPFSGLAIPAEVKVTAEVLAEPTLDLASHTWARLADGTPLVTAERRGKGWVVLVHTTANAEWSNLALSGLFPEMLRRLVMLAEGMPGKGGGPLPPLQLLDGLGRLGAPGPGAQSLSGDETPGPRHPPGVYGNGPTRVALNLGPAIGRPGPLTLPTGVRQLGLGGHAHEIDLRPLLLVVATVLFLLDLAATLWLRGVLIAAVLLMACLPAQAADPDAFAMEAGLKTRLAYVRTGDATTDRKSKTGLAALSRVVTSRSTAQLAEPMGLDLDADAILFFPLIYWPVTALAKPLSPAAVEKLTAYMRHGGLVVFDTGDGAAPSPQQEQRFQDLVQPLALPSLMEVTPEHVLTRSFYLLKEMPGRFDGGAVWVQDSQSDRSNDGVSPVVVGANDWAGAWAMDESGHPLYAAVPGGERQRELAFRSGVNLVMYALTGNYKADQVHLPAILERLGR